MKNDNMMSSEVPPSSLWSGGLLTICLVIFQSFISLSKIDQPALLAVYAFAVAIPILVYKILIDYLRSKSYRRVSQYQNQIPKKTPYSELVLFICGIGAAFFGITATFWRLHFVAAIVFVGISILVAIAYVRQAFATSRDDLY